MNTLTKLRVRLKSNETIDKNLQQGISNEKEHRKQVLIIIVYVVKCLVKNNLASQGSRDKLY